MARPGTFRPGQSGNPSGRPRAKVDIQLLARQHTAAALDALVRALDDPKQYVTAACALLDRGWGKPPQTVAVDPASVQPFGMMHLIAARRFSAELAAERTDSDDTTTINAKAEPTSLPNLMERALE